MKPTEAKNGVRRHLQAMTALDCISALVFLVFLTSCGGGGGSPGDTTPPATTASPAAGIYGSTQLITLASNEPATIYYSADGNMPSIGGSNTISGPSPIRDIRVSSDTTLLQFFAVGSFGNREPVKSETYVVSTGAATGPGDTQNYFPSDSGNLWGTWVTNTRTGSPPDAYPNSMTISGTKEINGVTAVVSRQSNPRHIMDVDEYLLKNSQGVTYLGNNDQFDAITNQFVPYQVAFFQSQPGSSFVQANKAGLDYGSDLDGDAKNETVDLKSIVNVKGLETVTVPAGIFPNSVRIETDLTLTVTLSSNKEKIAATAIQTQWLAPGIGPVKTVTAMSANGLSETESEELTAAIIAATFLRPATSLTAGSMPNSVAVGDFNNDGKLDMAVTNQGDPSKGFADSGVSVLLGDGTGSFGSANNLSAGTFAISAAVGDFNLDGKADLAVANFGSADVTILPGNGDGTFGAVTNLPLAANLNPTSIVTGDFNRDGKPDLAVAVGYGFSNATPGHVSILLGNGDGTFVAATNYTVGGAPKSVAVGDFNRDGTPDLAVANSLGGSISILLGSGTGTFGAATDVAVGDRPESVVVADFNGDGTPDLAVAVNSFLINNANVCILLGRGTGSFAAPTPFVVDQVLGAYLHSVAAVDLDGDGILDLSVAKEGTGSGGPRSNNVSVFLGNGTGSFSPVIRFAPVDGAPASVAVGDFSGDGKPDIAAATVANVAVLLNATP